MPVIPLFLAEAAAATTADSAAVAGATAAAAATPGWVDYAVAAAVVAGLLPALWYYARLGREAFAGRGRVEVSGFGPVEAGIATGLGTMLLVFIAAGFAAAGGAGNDPKLPEGHVIVLGVLLDTAFKVILAVGLVVVLFLRGQRPGEMFGLHRLRFGGVLGAGIGLLVAALPLVYAASFAAEHLTGGAERHGQEEAVRLLTAARDPASRLAMVVAAVVVAPVFEEFVFRGYLYGALRRYLGPAAGVTLNAALFAGIHLHVPSLAPLFIFAVCLTLAYERTGSLLVTMTMHALFNTLSVSMLIWGVGEE